MTAYLADTSAWMRCSLPAVEDRWVGLIEGLEIATCTPVRLELGFSARSAREHEDLRDELASLPDLELGAEALRRAEDVQTRLARRSHHRGPRVPDLLIAATAEIHGATLLHYDRHFDLIVEVTGQPAEWLAPRGSLD